jgi:hypothetical protein
MLNRAILALALGGLAACSVHRASEPRYTPASRMTTADERLPPDANLSQHERALSALTNARCDRETRCNNVGVNRTYENRAQCVASFDKDGYTDLDEDHCPLGIDQDRLGGCLSVIRAEACGTTLSRLDDLDACADRNLCVR